jgi:hypothetical protein
MKTTAFVKNLAMTITTASVLLVGNVAAAQVITIDDIEYTLGEQIFSTGGNATVEILPGNPLATFTSDLRLFFSLDPSQGFTAIGNSQEIGKIVDLGTFPTGQELFFGINVINTDQTYFVGPGERNPGNIIHAGLANLAPGVINVTFEDGENGGDFTYNDVQFQVRGAVSTSPVNTPQSVPEPTTFLGVFLAGGMGLSQLKSRKKA